MPQPGQPVDNDGWWDRWRLTHKDQWHTAFLGYLVQNHMDAQHLTAFELDQQYALHRAKWLADTGSLPG